MIGGRERPIITHANSGKMADRISRPSPTQTSEAFAEEEDE